MKCGHTMSRMEASTYTIADVLNRTCPPQAASGASSGQNVPMFDRGLAGTANGLGLTCPKCGSTSSFTPKLIFK